MTSEIAFVSGDDATTTLRAIRSGRLRRIRRGLVTSNVTDPIETVVARNWPEITAGFFPTAVLVDRTALLGGRDVQSGTVFVDQGPGGRPSRVVDMPGLRIVPRRGPGPVDGDVPYHHGLHVSSQHRAFLDNLRPSRTGARSVRRTATRSELEDRLVRLRAVRGDEALNDLRDRARQAAADLGADREAALLGEIVGALLGTQNAALSSENARATSRGLGFDAGRVGLFQRLSEELHLVSPTVPTRMTGDAQVFAFFESYFSNSIEGTEFTVDEARDNRAGATTFVAVEQVRGTLAKAFEVYQALPTGLPRAVLMMFAVSEVHPFTDGNGRIARIMCNAELSAAEECRLMIPTGYRQNYLSALGALTHNQNPTPIVRMLDYAARFTAAAPWRSIADATHWLEAAGAFDGQSERPIRIPQPWDL